MDTLAVFGPVLDLIGDVVTFTGGYFLARDVIVREKDATNFKKILKVVTAPELSELQFEVKNVVIGDEKDAEYALIRLSLRRARLGIALLIIGLCFLVFGKILEIMTAMAH